MKFKSFAAIAALSVAASLATQASAVVITSSSGVFSVGIAENGELYDAGAGVGFLRSTDGGYDPIAPGTPRDSWGLNASYADAQQQGVNLAGATTLIAGANTATATSLTTDGFQVVQNYSFVGDGNILQIRTTVTNLEAFGQSAIFQRNVDWDIDPTPFGENVFGPVGALGSVVDTSNFGFEDAAGNGVYSFGCALGCNSSGDLGAGIRLNLGFFNTGITKSFNYYYGINRAGEDVNTLIAQAQGAGAKLVMAGQSSENGDHPNLGANSAILGVGAIPEPATWATLILGFFGLGATLRRRRALTA
jgi:hypothetical protein